MSSQAPFITAPINDQVLSVYHHHHHRTNQWWWWVQKRTTIGTKPVKKRRLNKNKMANSGLLINWSDQICSLWYSLLLIWSPADKINTGYGVTSEADNKIQGITVHCHKSYVTLWLEGSPTTHTPRTRPLTISLTVRYSVLKRGHWDDDDTKKDKVSQITGVSKSIRHWWWSLVEMANQCHKPNLVCSGDKYKKAVETNTVGLWREMLSTKAPGSWVYRRTARSWLSGRLYTLPASTESWAGRQLIWVTKYKVTALHTHNLSTKSTLKPMEWSRCCSFRLKKLFELILNPSCENVS